MKVRLGGPTGRVPIGAGPRGSATRGSVPRFGAVLPNVRPGCAPGAGGSIAAIGRRRCPDALRACAAPVPEAVSTPAARAALSRRRGGACTLRLGCLVPLLRGRSVLPRPGRGSGVFRPRRPLGFVAFAAFLFGLRRLGLLRMHEHRGEGQQAAEDSVSGNCSRYIHEIRSCRTATVHRKFRRPPIDFGVSTYKGRTFHTQIHYTVAVEPGRGAGGASGGRKSMVRQTRPVSSRGV